MLAQSGLEKFSSWLMKSILQVVPITLNGKVQETPIVELDAVTIANWGVVAVEERESTESDGGMYEGDCCEVDVGETEPPVAFCCQFSLGQGTRTPSM